jgi:hypothetical protein
MREWLKHHYFQIDGIALMPDFPGSYSKVRVIIIGNTTTEYFRCVCLEIWKRKLDRRKSGVRDGFEFSWQGVGWTASNGAGSICKRDLS